MVFFSYIKSVNGTFSHGLSAKQAQTNRTMINRLQRSPANCLHCMGCADRQRSYMPCPKSAAAWHAWGLFVPQVCHWHMVFAGPAASS